MHLETRLGPGPAGHPPRTDKLLTARVCAHGHARRDYSEIKLACLQLTNAVAQHSLDGSQPRIGSRRHQHFGSHLLRAL